MTLPNEVALAEIVERFKKLGRFAKGKERDVLLQPYVTAEDDVATGKSFSPARIDHLRKVAAAAGIPVEKTTDESGFSERVLEFTASDETRDRYGDRILVDGMMAGEGGNKKFGKGWMLQNFKKNPVFMAFHQYSPDAGGSPFAGIPLGVALETFTDTAGKRKRLRMSVLMDDGTSNPLAPFITNAYKNKLMRAVSVGFWPEKVYQPSSDEERDAWGLGQYGFLFGQQELWENSAVSIPANPNALLENGAPLWDVDQAKNYERFAEEVKDVSPEFAYQLRSALARGTGLVQIGAPKDEPELKSGEAIDMEGLVTRAVRATLSSDIKPSVDELAGAVQRLQATVETLTARVQKLLEGAEVPTRGKETASPAPASTRSGEDDEPDPYRDLLDVMNQTREAFASRKK